MAEGREDFERRAAEAIVGDTRPPDAQIYWPIYHIAARRVLDALGLTVETVWTGDGKPKIWDHIQAMDLGGELYLRGQQDPATDDELRAIGMRKQRRLVSGWEEVDQ